MSSIDYDGGGAGLYCFSDSRSVCSLVVEGEKSMTLTSALTINSQRLHQRIDQLALIGKLGDTGVCRLALSKEDLEGVLLVKSWMEEAGLAARIDDF